MADDGDFDTLPPARARRKREWQLGNVFEGAFTYASPLIYTFIMTIWILWGPDALTPEEQLGAYRVFFLLSLLTIGLFGVGCLIGSEARFSAKPHRILIGAIATISPVLVPILMWARSGPGADTYRAVGLDGEFGGLVVAVAILLMLPFLKMYTAVRRVKEVTGEH